MIDSLISNNNFDYQLEPSTTELSFGGTLSSSVENLLKMLDTDSIDIALIRECDLEQVMSSLSTNGVILIFGDSDITLKYKAKYKFDFTYCHLYEFATPFVEEFYGNFFAKGIVNKSHIEEADAMNKEMTMINLSNCIGDEESTILVTDQRFTNFFSFMRITGRRIIMPIEDQKEFYRIADKIEKSTKHDVDEYVPKPTLF